MKEFFPWSSEGRRTPSHPDVRDKIRGAAAKREEYERDRALRDEGYRRESDARRAERRRFLTETFATPAPLATYALWLKTYLSQGHDITHPLPRQYPRIEMGIGEHAQKRQLLAIGMNSEPIFGAVEVDYTDSDVVWMPQKPFLRIPTGYGALAMTILVTPHIDLLPESLQPTSGDRRRGWEFGHTTLLLLQEDASSPSGLTASTNKPDVVESYPDVEQYILES